ncbi:TIGR02444 family protein [Devosia sp. Leaf420]|uniref:TIGR02444 family protein n=1 Tax=Devosia sp. Leaf420 TaxID=1736374 RepID=UPI000A5255CA|nr:TIGR02444 family protein [Devosia sp. Leaf420]
MSNPGFLQRVWPDMCAAYRDAALGRACLDLQERYNVDVPLLLVLCIADRVGHGIAAENLDALVIESEDWRAAAIEPLRRARQAMKGRFTAPSEQALRDDIKRLELEAERLHVQRLAEAFPPAGGEGGVAASQYLALRGVPTDIATQFLQTFDIAYDAQVAPVVALD